MNRLCAWVVCGAMACAAAQAVSDWLCEGGDAQGSRWQRNERELNPQSVKKLRLIWKRKLESGALSSAPVILGRLITYRGTVELVFVATASGEVYAVDGDFGTVFWKRQLKTGAPASASCPPAAPVLTPLAAGFDEDDDGPQPARPLYILSAGRLYALNPQDGRDLSAPRQFLPPGARQAALRLIGTTLYAAAGPCGGAPGQTFSIDVSRPESKPVVRHGGVRPSGAAWQDARGVKWTASAGPAPRGAITAFRAGRRAWATPELIAPSPPVVAGGLLFALSQSTLYAFDAAGGRQLYSSGNEVAASNASALAVANGHVCFTAADALYCFGFPVDI